MFSRLLKHEWRANSGLFGILTLAALGIGVLATVILRVLVNNAESIIITNDVLGTLALVAMGMFLFFSIVALSVYMIAVQFILLYRFYKNKFTDEGYLTFTLPVKTTHIFWSSFVNMLLWLAIAGAVVAVIVLLAILFGTATEGLVNPEFFEILGDMFRALSDLRLEDFIGSTAAVIYAVEMLLQLLVAPFYGLFIPMCCITLGAVLAKKHKILASFGIYYGVNFVVGIITSVASLLPTLLMVSGGNEEVYMVVTGSIQLFVTTALTLGAYFLTIHLMKRKLNLP